MNAYKTGMTCAALGTVFFTSRICYQALYMRVESAVCERLCALSARTESLSIEVRPPPVPMTF